MMLKPHHHRPQGFTLIELLIGVAVLVILLALVAPSFKRMMEMQRLRGINAQLVTDMQLARSEAAARGSFVRVTFSSDPNQSCYSIYAYKGVLDKSCDCLQPTPCTNADFTELRTVRVPVDSGVTLRPCATCTSPSDAIFDPITGGLLLDIGDVIGPAVGPFSADTRIDDERILRTMIGPAGRPSVCRPTGSTVEGVPACS